MEPHADAAPSAIAMADMGVSGAGRAVVTSAELDAVLKAFETGDLETLTVAANDFRKAA